MKIRPLFAAIAATACVFSVVPAFAQGPADHGNHARNSDEIHVRHDRSANAQVREFCAQPDRRSPRSMRNFHACADAVHSEAGAATRAR